MFWSTLDTFAFTVPSLASCSFVRFRTSARIFRFWFMYGSALLIRWPPAFENWVSNQFGSITFAGVTAEVGAGADPDGAADPVGTGLTGERVGAGAGADAGGGAWTGAGGVVALWGWAARRSEEH